MNDIVVKPAYGKTYNSVADIIKAWESNKDFQIVNGPYINKSDYKKYGNPLDSVLFDSKGTFVILEIGLL